MKKALWFAVFLILSGCGFYYSKNQPDQNLPQGKSASYASVSKSVILPACVSCHNQDSARAGVMLDTYTNVKNNLLAVKRAALEKKTMPPGRALSRVQQKMLSEWIAKGAPEVVKDEPVSQPPVLVAKYSSIKEVVLNQKCMVCHGEGGRQYQKYPLEPYQKLMDSRVITVGNAETSPFYTSMVSGSMPTKRSNLPKVTAEELKIIKQWIENGVPE